MTIEEKVTELLREDTGVMDLVEPANIKPPGDWQNLTGTWIVHFPLSRTPIHTHSGPAKLRERQYQTSVFAKDSREARSYKTARALADAVIEALEGNHQGVQFFLMDEIVPAFEADVKVQQIAITWRVFEAMEA